MEQWKDILGYEGLYKISNKGRVKSLSRKYKHRNGYRTVNESIRTLSKNKDGYMQLALSKEGNKISYGVHRLMAIAFIPNQKNKRTVNHINGDKVDNRIENIEWASDKENIHHACINGLRHSKLTINEVKEIKELLKEKKLKQYEIAKLYGVTKWNITKINTGKHWSYIK